MARVSAKSRIKPSPNIVPPTIEDPVMDRVIKDIYTIISELKSSVNVGTGEENTASSGKIGDMRVVKNKDAQTYSLEGKTEDGWVSTPANLQTSMTRAGAAIFPSGMSPSPGYDSGWVAWDWSEYTAGTDNPLTLSHDLNTLPRQVQLLFAPGQSVDGITWFSPLPSYLDSGYNHGIVYKVTSTQILLLNGDVVTYVASNFASPSNQTTYQDGSIRVLIWK